MKILKAKVQWNKGFANSPEFMALVDAYPSAEDFKYVAGPCGIYYAELDGAVDFFYYSSPGEGYGGRHFKLNMVDGSIKTLKGPWSSRAGAMNRFMMSEFFHQQTDFDSPPMPCSEVLVFTKELEYDRGYTAISGSFTLPRLLECAELASCELVVHYDDDEDEAEGFVKGKSYKWCEDWTGNWSDWKNVPIDSEFRFSPSLCRGRIIKSALQRDHNVQSWRP